MIIKFSPQYGAQKVAVVKMGDILTINNIVYDFSPLPEGALLPPEAISTDVIVGDVTRLNGDVIITITIPYIPDDPESVRFPSDLIKPKDGLLEIPQ